MEHDKRYFPEPPPGIPRLSGEEAQIYAQQMPELDEVYARLQEENPELAHHLMVFAEQSAPRNAIIKRAIAGGALYFYHLLSRGAETRQLEAMFRRSFNGDADDEAPPPST